MKIRPMEVVIFDEEER